MTIIKKTFDGTWARGSNSPFGFGSSGHRPKDSSYSPGKVSRAPPQEKLGSFAPPKKLTQKSKNIIKKLEGRGFQTVT